MRDDVLHSQPAALLGVLHWASSRSRQKRINSARSRRRAATLSVRNMAQSARIDVIIGRSDDLALRIGHGDRPKRQPVTSRPNATRAMLHSCTSLAPS